MCVCEDVLWVVMVMGMRLEVEMQMWGGTGTDTAWARTRRTGKGIGAVQRSACAPSHTLLHRAMQWR